MHICYVDESGCTGSLPDTTSDIQPVLALLGVVANSACLVDLTHDFLAAKRRFFPHRNGETANHQLNWMLVEIKGADLRKSIAVGSRRERSHAIGFLDQIFSLLEKFGVRIVGRVWIKGVSAEFKGNSVYTFSIQNILEHFERFLSERSELGLVVADSRTKSKNANVSHSIFTRKFRRNGDPYPHILEMPVFGHSDNHALIQIADLLCSAVLSPIATHTYCTGHLNSIHVRPGYDRIKSRYADRLRNLQYRYLDGARAHGGIVVSDALMHTSGNRFFHTTLAGDAD